MWQYAIFSATLLLLVLGVGDYLSVKTKGIFGSILLMTLVYIVGYQTGLIPTTTPADTGLVQSCGNFAMLCIITNLGTMIDLKQFAREWKTVVVCLVSLVALGAGFVTVGSMVFGKDYALCALPAVAGAVPAAQMVSSAATNAGKPVLAGFATLICALQSFVGIPVSAICLNKAAQNYKKSDMFLHAAALTNGGEEDAPSKLKIIKKWPNSLDSSYFITGKVLLVACLGVMLSTATGGKLPAAVVVLFFGTLFSEIGFLEHSALQKAGMANFCVLTLLASLLPTFATLSMQEILSLLVPLAFFLVLGAILLCIGGGLCGKFIFKEDFYLSMAYSLSAMFGFPTTMIITNDVIRGLQMNEEDSKRMNDYLMPKMIIAGFTSVTICSVAIAGFVLPMVFG